MAEVAALIEDHNKNIRVRVSNTSKHFTTSMRLLSQRCPHLVNFVALDASYSESRFTLELYIRKN